MKTLRRSRRGAATVELAVLMIVLIPSILYTMYLEDLLFYKFDLEETVVSSPWDFANQDFRKNSTGDITGTVRTSAMQTFWDHTSAWNTYEDANYDAKELIHHQAATAHQCWLAKGGKEIQCEVSKTVGMVVEPTFNFKNKGGLASCNATLGVQNYFIPNNFMEWFGKVSITGDGKQKMMKHEGGNSAGDGTDYHTEAAADPYLYPPMEFGVLHDAWALYKMEDINPDAHPADQLTEFSSWIRIPYGRFMTNGVKDANQFAQDAIDKEILDSQVKVDLIGDMLETPPLAWKAAPEREFNGHHTSAWTDKRHSDTQGKLEDKYMGLPETTW